MRAILLEDEDRAANRLKRLVSEVDPSIEVIEVFETVRDAKRYFGDGRTADIIFSDIQLADGLSFDLFESVDIECPVIFTTAFDQYAIKAFKNNGIDYLLKPVAEKELRSAIERFKSRLQPASRSDLKAMSSELMERENVYRRRFTVKAGNKLRPISVDELSAVFSENKGTYLLTMDGRQHLVDHTMESLAEALDPSSFFRVSRKYIIHMQGVKEMVIWSNSRLKLHLTGSDDEDIIVARERTKEFKEWMDR